MATKPQPKPEENIEAKQLHPYGLLPDAEIARLCREEGMIEPFETEKVREVNGLPVISYGLSSYGYDIRLAPEFKIAAQGGVLDPHAPHLAYWRDGNVSWINEKPTHLLNPGEMILSKSVEQFNMPNDVLAVCVNKSTWARNGVFANITPLEPGWKGFLTIEISNIGHAPVRLYFQEGIAQLLFLRGSAALNSYEGKYQDQVGIVTGKA